MEKFDILKTMLISISVNILFVFLFLLQEPQNRKEKIIPPADDFSTYEEETLSAPKDIIETTTREEDIVAKEVLEPGESEKVDYVKETDREKFDFVSGFIVGSYKINSRMQYNFGINGLYTGFFDSANPNIHQGSYEIKVKDGIVLLHIYNNDKSAVVTYQIHIQDTSKIVLYYESLDLKITLKK